MAKVWKSGLPKNQKMALLAYADHANDDGTSVYPGEDVMAEKTSDSPGNVRRVPKLLIEDGVLIQTKRGHRGQRAEFRIDIERLDAHIARHSEAAHGGENSRAESAESRALASGKARATATPNHPEPSEPSENHPGRARDYLWEAVIEIHGDPATKGEREKYNAAVKDLKGADVTPDEYPALVAAFVTKHSRNGNPGPQPTIHTIAQRVGELRHFLNRGPIVSAGLEDVVEQQQAATLLTQQETDDYRLGGNT